MANIRGSYSLTELCAELALSPSWVKKIENHLNLSSWGSGQRGKKSFYTDHQFEFFRKISILRFLGFGLEDIKSLFDRENDILNYTMDNYPAIDAEDEGSVEFVPLYLLTNIYCGSHGAEIDAKKHEGDKAKEDEMALKLDTMITEYKNQIKTIAKRFTRMHQHMAYELEYLKTWK